MNAIEEAGLQVTATMTTPSRLGKQPRPVWNVSGNLAPWTSLLYELGGRKYRRVFSFFTDPTEMLEQHLPTATPDTYKDRLEAKATRAKARVDVRTEWADKADVRSEVAFAGAHAAIDGIPPGQPILCGHHSERRHRAAPERHDRRVRRSVEEDHRATHHRERAASAEQTAARARGEVSPAFAERRIREAEAELRRLDRMLTKQSQCTTCQQPIRDDNTCSDGCAGVDARVSTGAARQEELWRIRIQRVREEQVQKRDHWRGVLDGLGVTYTRSTIAVTDRVKVRSHDWARVVRCNPTTITVTWDDGPLRGMSGKYLYSEIAAHKPADR